MSAWTIRIEAETDASAERALRQALKSLPLAEDDSAPYRLEINSEDVSDGPLEGVYLGETMEEAMESLAEGEANEALRRSAERTNAFRLTRHDGSNSIPDGVAPTEIVRVQYKDEHSFGLHENEAINIPWDLVAWYRVTGAMNRSA